VADLRRIVASMTTAARAADVSIATGDTRVVQRGEGDACYVTTAGWG
jgi:hydrogenase expression/formation protein HypE